MPQKKAEQIGEMSEDELRAKERELQEQLFRLRFQKSIGQLDNAMKIRQVRRDIARVKTVLRQKEIRQRAQPRAEAAGR
jgi:large subunit ribosomal protein L29